jgi:tRNA (guanine-N7-)-methyltransferase
VDDPVRTAGYLARLRQRRQELSELTERLFAGHSAMVWEVGSGHGHFLTAYAAAHPQQVCVGVDITAERVERAVRKRDRARLANLHFIHADAADFLSVLPAAVRLAAIYILFPDPWPKRRHRKNRLLQAPFLAAAAARAGEGARLYLRTDYEPYFTEARQALAASPHWRIAEAAWPFELTTVFQARARQYHSLVAVRHGAG